MGKASVAKLAEALRSGGCPAGLLLYLGMNRIGDVGATKLAEALSTGRLPPWPTTWP
jgi:hypothetical protein